MRTNPPDDYEFEGKAHWEGHHLILDFGPYAGESLDSIDVGFLRWMMDKDFPEDLLGEVDEELQGRLG